MNLHNFPTPVAHVRFVGDSLKSVDPAIHSPRERVRNLVRIRARKTGIKRFPFSILAPRHAVAVFVLEKKGVRRVSENDSAAGKPLNPRTNIETLGERADLFCM